jgi:hypothetical protein
VILPPALLIASAWLLLHLQGYTLVDDAYISFRYAKNLALGHGLVWNPGEPVEGYTNLLWVLLLTPFASGGIDLAIPSAVLGTLFSVGALEVLRRIARLVLPHRTDTVWVLPGLILALQPSFSYWTVSGMETPMFVFFVLGMCGLLLRGIESRGRQWLAGGAMSAAYLTRPEGAMAAGLLSVAYLLFGRVGSGWRERFADILFPGLILVAVVLLHLTVRLHYYGFPLPNTFYAKVILGSTSVQRGIAHLLTFLNSGGWVIVLGMVWLRQRSPLGTMLRFAYLLLAVFLVYIVSIGGDLPGWYRFYVPLIPLPLVGLAELLAVAGQKARGLAPGISRRGLTAAGFLLLLLLTGAQLLLWPRAEPSSVLFWKTGHSVGHWLIDNFFRTHVPRDSYLAVSAVGYFGYYTDYRIIDTWGLNDTHIAHRPVEVQLAAFAHEKQDWTYVLERKPDVHVYRPGWPTDRERARMTARLAGLVSGDGARDG